MMIESGQLAPEFALYDTDREKRKLSDYRGRTILILFFPLAFTRTCTKELCEVRDDLSWYNDLNVQVMAISVDSLHSLKKYKEEQELNFLLLSDFNKQVSAAYNSLYDVFSYDMRGVSKRSAFVIDAAGIIRYLEILEDASGIPDFETIRGVLEGLPKS